MKYVIIALVFSFGLVSTEAMAQRDNSRNASPAARMTVLNSIGAFGPNEREEVPNLFSPMPTKRPILEETKTEQPPKLFNSKDKK